MSTMNFWERSGKKELSPRSGSVALRHSLETTPSIKRDLKVFKISSGFIQFYRKEFNDSISRTTLITHTVT